MKYYPMMVQHAVLANKRKGDPPVLYVFIYLVHINSSTPDIAISDTNKEVEEEEK